MTKKSVILVVDCNSSSFFLADKPIGFSTLGGSMFTRGKSLEHWEEVLKYQKTYIQRWHKIQDLQSESNKSSGGEGPPGNALGDGSLGLTTSTKNDSCFLGKSVMARGKVMIVGCEKWT